MPHTRGRAWRLGNDVDTDAIIPSRHLVKQDPREWTAHVLENLRPDFAAGVKPGDVIVAGESFGSGSSREQAAVALVESGLSAVIATSFARNFYRNGFNNGLLLIEPESSIDVADGDELELDLASYTVTNKTSGRQFALKPLPPFLLEMHRTGGLIPWLNQHGGVFDAAGS